MRASGWLAGLVSAVVLTAGLGGAAGAQSPSPSPGAPAGVLDVPLVAAVGHWLVLQLRTGWFDPATIRVD
ncbi:MAG: hypothetical protein U0869_20610 [Chloroflexota bacterium]